MTRAELLRDALPSANYFFVVIVIRNETTAAARWALLFIVRTFFNHTFSVALWTSFHTRALTVFSQRKWATRRSGQILVDMPSLVALGLRSHDGAEILSGAQPFALTRRFAPSEADFVAAPHRSPGGRYSAAATQSLVDLR
jgi:hypothetical protein